jgi:hypothetical protein
MTIEIKKFNLKSTVSDAELKAADPVRVGKVFEPGIYDLEIKEAALNVTETNPEGRAKGDPSWLVYKIVLGDTNGRTIRTFVLTPTEDVVYKKPGMKKEHRLVVAQKLREFFRALKEKDSLDDIGGVLNKLFVDPTALVGRVLKTRIGYKGNYIQYQPDTKTYGVVDKKGTPVLKRTYPDRDAAIAETAELGIEVTSFPEVLKFLS